MAKTKKKYYAVSKGRKTGIFGTWDECKAQVHQFKGAKFKGFHTLEEAQDFIGIVKGQPSQEDVQEDVPAEAPVKQPTKRPIQEEEKENSISLASPVDDAKPAAKRRKIEPNVTTTTNSIQSIPSVWTVLLSFDGGSRGNPGVAGSGAEVVVVERTTKGIQKVRTKIHARWYLGSVGCTNNMAEWKGVLIGLEQLEEHVERFLAKNENLVKPTVKLVIQGDSQLVVRQLTGRYQVKDPKLQPYKFQVDQVLTKLTKLVQRLRVSYEHVYRNDNKVADGLANEAMDAKKSWVTRTEDVESSDDEEERDVHTKRQTKFADV